MNNIDFLPKSYHEQRAMRNFKHRRLILVLLVGMALVVWGIDRHQTSMELAQRASALETELVANKLKLSERDKLRDEKKALIYQENIQKQLDQPIEVTQAVAVVGRLMPPSTGLTHITVKTHRPAPKPKEDPNDTKTKKTKKTAPVNPEELRDYVSIEVKGFAPDDVVVADLVNAMNDHPLFESVAMHFSRVDEQGGLILRRFSIGAEIPLDRQYEPTFQTAGVSDED